jgi:Ser/Thr protein kinase RdoA (MazF antagonist)
VFPKLNKLNSQLIHNDANDNNIVVDQDLVNALIDFGDVIYAPRVCGLAVACAYVITDLSDPVRDVLPVIRGYNLTNPLTQVELELVFGLVKLRVATSIVMAAIQSATTRKRILIN